MYNNKFKYIINDAGDKIEIERAGEFNLLAGENPDEKARECICMVKQDLNKEDVEVYRVKSFDEDIKKKK